MERRAWAVRATRWLVMSLVATSVSGLGELPLLWAQTDPESAQPVKTSKPPGKAEALASDAAIKKKLDEILANQATILQKLDAMTEELRIIKIRATR